MRGYEKSTDPLACAHIRDRNYCYSLTDEEQRVYVYEPSVERREGKLIVEWRKRIIHLKSNSLPPCIMMYLAGVLTKETLVALMAVGDKHNLDFRATSER